MPWREFQLDDGKSKKFWRVRTRTSTLEVEYGRIGTLARSSSKACASRAEAERASQKLIKEKLAKGYAEVKIRPSGATTSRTSSSRAKKVANKKTPTKKTAATKTAATKTAATKTAATKTAATVDWPDQEIQDAVIQAEFSAAGDRLITLCALPGPAGMEETAGLKVWAPGKDQPLWSHVAPGRHFNTAETFAVSPDDRLVVAGYKTLRVWDLATGKTIRAMSGHKSLVTELAFSEDSSHLASVSRDKTLRVWRLRDGKCTFALAHERELSDVTFLPGGRAVVTGCMALGEPDVALGALQKIDLDTKRVTALQTQRGEQANWFGLNVSRDGKHLVVAAGGKGRFALYDTGSLKRVATVSMEIVAGGSFARLLPDGKLLAVCLDKLALWQLKPLRMLAKLPSSGSPAAISSDGRFIAFTPIGKGGVMDGKKDLLLIRAFSERSVAHKVSK